MDFRKLTGLVLLLAASACAQNLPSAPSVQGSQANGQQLPTTPAPQAPQPQNVVALHYTVRMQRMQGTTVFEAWAGATSAKSQVRETDDPGFRPGIIIITQDNGELRQMANLARGDYFEITRQQQDEMARQRMGGVSLGPLTTKQAPDEPGEKVLGMTTTLHRVEMDGAFTSDGARHTIHATHELWLTREVTMPNPKLESLFGQNASGIPQLDEAMSFAELAGFPVRRITTIEIDGQRIGRSSYELLSVERVRIPERDLELPPGLKEVQLPSR